MALERDAIYRGTIIDLDVETVDLPNGRRCRLEIVRHPGGAAVVAVDGRRNLCLLRQYRHAVGGWLWELPAGKIDHGEPPVDTARRELMEEAGVAAAEWRPLGLVVSSPGVFTEVVHLFLATDLSRGVQRPEANELLEVHWLPFETAVEWAHEGRIEDAKSLVGLFRAAGVLGA